MPVASPSVDVPLQYIYRRRENRVILLIVVWIRGDVMQEVVIVVYIMVLLCCNLVRVNIVTVCNLVSVFCGETHIFVLNVQKISGIPA